MANEFGVNINIGVNQWAAVYNVLLRMIKAGWWVRASSDGVTKVVSDDPTAHAGNTGTGFSPQNTVNSGTTASITAVDPHPYGNLVTLTGLSGLIAPTVAGGQSEGNFLTISGAATSASNGSHQIYEVLSPTSCKVLVRSGTPVAGDANNGAISWQEKGMLVAPAYGSLGSRQWWVLLEGMETYQLSFSSAPVGEFLRGEPITQAGTGATGECIGIVWDAATLSGWMIVMPRTGQFNGTGVITGSTSGATVTPTILYKWRRQMVFTKGNTVDNHTGSGWYYIFNNNVAAQVTESYLTKASHAACTATVAPGASTTAGNRQVDPAVSGGFYVLRCQNNSTFNGSTALVHADGIICEAAGNVFLASNGRVQCAAANIMPRSNRSADGTWWVFHGNTNAGNGGNLLGHFRMDATDDGSAELLLSFAHCDSSLSYRDVRYRMVTGNNNARQFYEADYLTSTQHHAEWMWIWNAAARGAVIPSYNYGQVAHTISTASLTQGGCIMARNWGATQRLVAHPAAVPPGFKEPIAIGNGFYGRLRWMYSIQQGGHYNTFEGRKFICISDYLAGTRMGIMIGPWDQTSDPVQA